MATLRDAHTLLSDRDVLVGRLASYSGADMKPIADIVPSRRGHNCCVIFDDGQELELSTYCRIYVD